VTLRHAAVYFNTNSPNAAPIEYSSPTELTQKLEALIFKGEARIQDNHYILEPISGDLRVEICSEKVKFERPRAKVMLSINSITAAIDRHQYLNIIGLSENFTLYSKGLKYLKYRPPENVLPTQDPLEWWTYAFRSVHSEIHEKNKRMKWDYIAQRRADRIAYITLYKRSKKKIFHPRRT